MREARDLRLADQLGLMARVTAIVEYHERGGGAMVRFECATCEVLLVRSPMGWGCPACRAELTPDIIHHYVVAGKRAFDLLDSIRPGRRKRWDLLRWFRRAPKPIPSLPSSSDPSSKNG